MDVGSGGGIVRLDGVALPAYPYTLEVDSGTTVTVEAVPNFGRVFDSWSGDLRIPANPAPLVINCDKDITARFSTDWLLFGSAIGSLVLVIFLGSVLIIRRRAD